MKKILIGFALLIIIVIITISITSNTTETILTDHPLVGQVFKAGDAVFYQEDCTNFNSCGNTPRDKEINRTLVCRNLSSSATSLYNKSYLIPEETTFTLIELLIIQSHGLQIGGSNYVLAVLRDNNGLLSTRPFSFITQLDQPFGFKAGSICDGHAG